MVDALTPAAGDVTVVHPPEVHLITRAQVMTDKKAALILARLHAAGLLSAVWISTPEVRALRTLISQRFKMIQLLTQAKCRLQAVLHRHHLGEPPCSDPFTEKNRPWWESLPVEPIEQFRIAGDLDTITFAGQQIGRIEAALAKHAAEDERIPYLVQLPGFGLINSLTVLVAIWHVLTKREVDRHGNEEQIACSFFALAYKMGVANLPNGMSAKQYTRHCLDVLGIGKELTEIPWAASGISCRRHGRGDVTPQTCEVLLTRQNHFTISKPKAPIDVIIRGY